MVKWQHYYDHSAPLVCIHCVTPNSKKIITIRVSVNNCVIQIFYKYLIYTSTEQWKPLCNHLINLGVIFIMWRSTDQWTMNIYGWNYKRVLPNHHHCNNQKYVKLYKNQNQECWISILPAIIVSFIPIFVVVIVTVRRCVRPNLLSSWWCIWPGCCWWSRGWLRWRCW